MNLKIFIENRDLSLYKISKQANIPYTTLCDLVNGKTDIMKCAVETIHKLSIALGLSMDDIINGNDEKPKPLKAHTKQEFFRQMLRNRKNVILARDSALEYMNLTDGNFSNITKVYSTVDLPEPFIVNKVKNFNDIEYSKIDGILICSVSQCFNDMLEDENTDLQILDQAISHYYYYHNKSFDGLFIKDKNIKKFNEEVPYAMEYYNN